MISKTSILRERGFYIPLIVLSVVLSIGMYSIHVQYSNSEEQLANLFKSGKGICSWMRSDLAIDKGVIFYDYYLDGIKQQELDKGNCIK